jgi:hypothetical protein
LTNGEDPYDDSVVKKLIHPNLKLLLVTEGPDGCRYYSKVMSICDMYTTYYSLLICCKFAVTCTCVGKGSLRCSRTVFGISSNILDHVTQVIHHLIYFSDVKKKRGVEHRMDFYLVVDKREKANLSCVAEWW